MKFKISNIELAKISELVKVTSSVADVSIRDNLYIMSAEKDKLTAVVYGNGNIIEFSVNITEFDDQGSTNHFYVDISKFIQSVTNSMLSSGLDYAEVTVNGTSSTAVSGKSKITINMFEGLEEDEYEDALTAFEVKTNEFFSSLDNKVLIKPELMELAGVVNKYITMFNPVDVSGIAVENNKFIYSDQAISFVEKTLSYEASSERKVIPQSIFSLLTSLVKTNDVELCYSEDDQYVRIDMPNMNYKAILCLPSAVCEYPNEEEYDFIRPDKDNKVSFDINIELLLKKLSSFDGILSSTVWKWKQIDFELNKNETSALLYHNSASAEFEADVEVSNVEFNSDKETLEFRFPAAMLSDYLGKLTDKTGDVHIEATPLPISKDTPHSYGVGFSTEGLDITLCKILVEDVL